jgi:acetoin utilization protein AcuB
MLVRNRMSKRLVTADPQLSLAESRKLLSKNRIRHLPVVEAKRLVGIVSDRDLLSAPATARTIGEVMTPKPITIAPDVPVDEAARVLRAHKIDALPVIDNKQLLGIVTSTDILDAFVDLSGVTEPTYYLTVTGADTAEAERQIRMLILQYRGYIRWMHRDSRKRGAPLRLRVEVKRIEDLVTELEAAGFEVEGLVSSTRR